MIPPGSEHSGTKRRGLPRAERGGRSGAESPLDVDVGTVPGVGPQRSAALHARAICTLYDVLTYLPYRYDDLRRRDVVQDVPPGSIAIVEGVLQNVIERPMPGRWSRRLVTALLKQAPGGTIRVVWFNLRTASLPLSEPLVLVGRIHESKRGIELVHPEIYRLRLGSPPPIRPVYSLPAEIPQRLFSRIVAKALRHADHAPLGAIPAALRDRANILPVLEALQYLHQPPAEANIEELQSGRTPAHRALALDEMFTFQCALARERARQRTKMGAVIDGPPHLSSLMRASLPFTLTPSQQRSIDEISSDLAAPSQMNRILIGDVGTGKTVVAFHAAIRAAESGWQVAIMAPTELLAEQHFANFNSICGRLGISAALLTGKMSARERTKILRALQRGDIAVVFGTHALIQEGVALRRLGLAIIDEQHRFGVFDRARLAALGSEANVLLMTATPIPRSLAMALFRNLDVSSLQETPSGRIPVESEVVTEDALEAVDARVRAELESGRQAYYILPAIDSNDDSESVIAAAQRLRSGSLQGFAIGTLHGRMRPAEKDEVMRCFRDGSLQILVSTTVVEVGIDVPRASAIVIIGAERYGTAQLHQLRGRVGRGNQPSRCWFVVSRQSSREARARIEQLARCGNGAEVAELDLKVRGPGDLFGARQTGALPLRFARLISDSALISQAGDLAAEWSSRDPDLTTEESAGLRTGMRRMLELGFSLADVG
jgi:ATP-dependent DNA helicase RecG